MKIVNEPPKTGEQFIVNWFDDGRAKTTMCKWHEADDQFYIWSWGFGEWFAVSPIKEKTYFNDKVIIIE